MEFCFLGLFPWSICMDYKCLGILPILGKVATDAFMVKLQDSRQCHMKSERRAEVYGIWLAILYLRLYLYSTYYNFCNRLISR
jgi:hypothetical protein